MGAKEPTYPPTKQFTPDGRPNPNYDPAHVKPEPSPPPPPYPQPPDNIVYRGGPFGPIRVNRVPSEPTLPPPLAVSDPSIALAVNSTAAEKERGEILKEVQRLRDACQTLVDAGEPNGICDDALYEVSPSLLAAMQEARRALQE